MVDQVNVDVNERVSPLLEKIFSIFSQAEIRGVTNFSSRLLSLYGENIAQCKIMIAYGGGKDSSYTVAFVRACQLHIREQVGHTFKLRIANMRHAGVPFAVAENINRVYTRLNLLDDPLVELLTVDNDSVIQFHINNPIPDSLRNINRLDILMNGHRSRGDGRPTFCNSCNLSVSNFYGLACWWGDGVDVVITGDSKKEQKHYFTWIMRMGESLGLDTNKYRNKGFKGLLTALNQIGEKYYRNLYGSDNPAILAARHVNEGGNRGEPLFLSIYDEVDYKVDEHWELIVDFLGFDFDELAFSFTESDCANPAVMAHLRGLKIEYVDDRTYHEGIEEYLQLAEMLMRKKEMPDNLIQLALGRYSTVEKVEQLRKKIDDFCLSAFGLNEISLICLVYSPFVANGRRLERFIAKCFPDWAIHCEQMHAILNQQNQQGNSEVSDFLTEISGLSLPMLRQLYRNSEADFSNNQDIISLVRSNDPHKGSIKTYNSEEHIPTVEIISGR